MTSFPRSLSCRPPSNWFVPPNDARASWLALGTLLARRLPRSRRSLASATVAQARCPSARRRCYRKPLPLAVVFVVGWLRLSLRVVSLRSVLCWGREEEGQDWGLTSRRCRRRLRGCYDQRARRPPQLCAALVAAVRQP